MIPELVATGSLSAIAALLLGSGIGYVARTWIGERLKQSVRHEYRSDLEAYKHELRKLETQIEAVQATATSALTEGQRVTAEWRIKAVNDLWIEMLRLRRGTPHLVFYVDIMQPSQYPQLWTNPKITNVASYVEDQVKALVGGSSEGDIEYVRPFLGEEIFAKFFAYRAIFGRVAYVLKDGVESRSLDRWFRDKEITEIIAVVFSSEELMALEALQSGHFSYMRNLLEAKILADLRRVVSGEVSTAEGLEQGRKILATVQRIDAEAEYGRDLT